MKNLGSVRDSHTLVRRFVALSLERSPNGPPGRFFVTISAIVPMTDSHDHLQVALSVLLAVSASYPAIDLPRRLHPPIILINFFCMNCWRPATARATHRQEVVC